MIGAFARRGAAWAAIFATLGLAVAGCAGQGGGQPYYPASSGYPYGYGATQQDTCGALGTCPPTGLPRIEPGDEHGD